MDKIPENEPETLRHSSLASYDGMHIKQLTHKNPRKWIWDNLSLHRLQVIQLGLRILGEHKIEHNHR